MDEITPSPPSKEHPDPPASPSSEESISERSDEEKHGFAPIKTNQSRDLPISSHLEPTRSHASLTEAELFKVLSRRKTSASGKQSIPTDAELREEQLEIERLMTRIFGQTRQANSEEEKTRHVGVVFRNLTVKGIGLGAALQPTLGDLFLGIPRLVKGLFSKGSNAASRNPPVRTILNDFTGCVRPGEMLLVLGRPGSGCSSFLKILANQRFGFVSVDGNVTYGGVDAETMAKDFRGECVYNPEDDLHYPTLTVKDTLEFALTTRTPGKASRNEGETRSEYVQEFLRVVTKLFWIEHTLKTKVGNAIVRGVSGGEKKRVSIAEAMITRASTQCWDNSSKGLDSNTAIEYIESIRTLTNMAKISSVVALYQASETLYNLFDKVILIDNGRCCYFGPTDGAKAYFEGLGFICQPRWTTADFLTSVTDEHERNVREGWENRIPRSAIQFEEAYRNSQIQASTIADVEEFENTVAEQQREREAAQTAATKKRNYSIPFHKQVIACTRRQFLVLWGDKVSLVGKWAGITFQSLIVGSVFFNMPQTSAGVFSRGGVMFLMLLFNALLALAELSGTFSSRPILLKHKSFSFYRPAAYGIAQVLVDVPLVLVQVSIFDIIVYFMSGLQRTGSQFFISLFTLWTLTMTMYSYFRALGSLAASLDVATRVLTAGYIIPPTSMRPWIGWLRWINPASYGFEILMSNEFYNLVIDCVPPTLVPFGPDAQEGHQACTLSGSQTGQTSVQGADYISSSFSYTRSHLWRNFGILFAMWLAFVTLTVIGMERLKPSTGGGAVTIFKRGQVPKSVEKSIEKGETPADEEMGRGDPSLLNSEKISENSGKVSGISKNEAIFTYRHVNYTIPVAGGQRQLLQDVQGYVRPGRLTALMGASGAGKTTLLNCLAQRTNFGLVTGDFLVDGRPLPRSFQRATGFAEQNDEHMPTDSIREALRFSALLRQPKEVPIAEKYEYVEKIIDLLEMRDIAGATIGVIGAGLNQEQRKRVTIGVELASKPELLMFLDEPTSGLDSGASINILRFLRKLADAGQAILCTIHQPSAILFEYFDELLLLKSGGRVVFHGPLGKDSRNLIEYFEKNGAKKCPPGANPAEYMLDAIGAGDPGYSGQDWGNVWEASPEFQQRSREIEQMIEERRQVSSQSKLDDDREFAMPLITQIRAVVQRSFIAYWRSPNYGIGKLALHVITGLFNTFSFWNLGNSRIDLQLRLFSIFMTLTISPPLIQQLQPRFLGFRWIYQAREANSKIYSWFAMTLGAVVVEIPYSIVVGTIYFNCWYWGVGFPRDSLSAGYTWLITMLFELYYVSFGQAIASFSPNEILASLLVPVFFIFIVLFCGIVVPYQALPSFWQSWMYPLSPFRYILEGYLGVALHNVPVTCVENEFARFQPPNGQSCQEYTKSFIQQVGGYVLENDGTCSLCQYANGDEYAKSLNVDYDYKWRDVGIVFSYIIFNYAIVFFCSWLLLIGGKKIKAVLSSSSRRQKKSVDESPAPQSKTVVI
ncbi:MAG: hypothetical protein M1829_004092 [Trizodia sp. TS-e1964]|nr:MAG: hypothetical protein M1829_004092 [Trizodia sp. TS-e1964]